MKWDATERAENTFTYGDADAIVAFAKDNKMKVRGHTLVWHQQTPAWVFSDADGEKLAATAASKQLVLSRLENHIRNVAGHFKDDVYAWDVVNEVIDEGQSDGLRLKTWPKTRLDLPLLFDEQLQAKPAYWAVVGTAGVTGGPKGERPGSCQVSYTVAGQWQNGFQASPRPGRRRRRRATPGTVTSRPPVARLRSASSGCGAARTRPRRTPPSTGPAARSPDRGTGGRALRFVPISSKIFCRRRTT